MKKNGEYVGVDEEFIPENEKYVDDSIFGNGEDSKRIAKGTANVAKGIGIIVIIHYVLAFIIFLIAFIGIGFIIMHMTKFIDKQEQADRELYRENHKEWTESMEKSSQIMSDNFKEFSKNMRDGYDESSQKIKEDFEQTQDDIDEEHNKTIFNMELESMQGTKGKYMLSNYLDKIVTSNKTNSAHLITVTYNETTTTEENGIVGIKQSLVDGKNYDVSVDYDADGYINGVIIRDV